MLSTAILNDDHQVSMTKRKLAEVADLGTNSTDITFKPNSWMRADSNSPVALSVSSSMSSMDSFANFEVDSDSNVSNIRSSKMLKTSPEADVDNLTGSNSGFSCEVSALLPAACALHEVPATDEVSQFVEKSRDAVSCILAGEDKRMFVVIQVDAVTNDVVEQLTKLTAAHQDNLLILAQISLEVDPRSFNKNMLDLRRSLIALNAAGVAVAAELNCPLNLNFFADLISYGTIGGEHTESQVHREMVSGVAAPVGWSNGTTGEYTTCLQVALDACQSSTNGHCYFGVGMSGMAGIVHSPGNSNCHVVLSRCSETPTFAAEAVQTAVDRVENHSSCSPGVVIDCTKEKDAIDAVVSQIKAGNTRIAGAIIPYMDAAMKFADVIGTRCAL